MSSTDTGSDESAPERTASVEPGEGGDTPTILIADDEAALSELYVKSLPDGYATRVAHDGAEALSIVDESVDVALLDRQMPRVNGDEVLARLREAGHDCRVAMLTGVEPDFDVLEMGFDAYLVKPIPIEELRETVERLLALANYDDDVRRYHALLTKRAALRAEKRPCELEDDERYGGLEAEIAALRERLADRQHDLDDVNLAALFDDLDGNAL